MNHVEEKLKCLEFALQNADKLTMDGKFTMNTTIDPQVYYDLADKLYEWVAPKPKNKPLRNDPSLRNECLTKPEPYQIKVPVKAEPVVEPPLKDAFIETTVANLNVHPIRSIARPKIDPSDPSVDKILDKIAQDFRPFMKRLNQIDDAGGLVNLQDKEDTRSLKDIIRSSMDHTVAWPDICGLLDSVRREDGEELYDAWKNHNNPQNHIENKIDPSC